MVNCHNLFQRHVSAADDALVDLLEHEGVNSAQIGEKNLMTLGLPNRKMALCDDPIILHVDLGNVRRDLGGCDR